MGFALSIFSLKQSEAQQLTEARVGTEEQMQRLKLAETELAQVCFLISATLPPTV